MGTMNVFVYGTLLQGQRNNYLLANSLLIGDAKVSGLQMHDLGYFPACVKSEDPKSKVVGEVWQIDDATLLQLDWLEGYNGENPEEGFYNRIEVDTKWGKAWVYICEEARGRDLIEGGDWIEYVRESDGF